MKKADINKLDRKWSRLVRQVGICESCLAEGVRLEAAHIKGRRHRGTRWGAWVDGVYDLCGMALCHECHQDYDEHGRRHDFIKRVVVGEERYEEIQKIAQAVAKYQSYEDINELLDGAVAGIPRQTRCEADNEKME